MWKICVCSDMQYMYILWYKNVHILYTHIHVYIHIHIWICIHTYMYIHIKYLYPQICKWYQTYCRNKRGTEKPLDENKRGEWKGWLKTQHLKNWDHGIQSHHFMANGKTMETVTDFIFLHFKITADGDCNHEINRRLLLRRKAMTNLDSILKSSDITLPTKVFAVGCTQSLSHVQLLATPWTVTHQGPLSMGFSRQEYWSKWPFPSPGIFPNQGLNPSLFGLLHRQVDSLPPCHRKPQSSIWCIVKSKQ